MQELINKEIIDIKEVAKYLNVSVSSIRKLIRTDKLPFLMIGKKYAFDKEKINKWIESKENKYYE